MDNQLICPECGSKLKISSNNNKLRYAWASCDSCNYNKPLSHFWNNYLISKEGYLDYKIKAGRLSSYNGFGGNISLPDCVSVIDGGNKELGSTKDGCFETKDITEVDTSKNLRYIGKYAFARCENLREVHLYKGLCHINEGAFFKCTSLEQITIPSTCYDIWAGAFQQCTSLKEVEILCDKKKDLRKWPELRSGAFRDCSNLERVRLPYGLKDIRAELFCNCSSLKSINIPETVSTIEESAFENCSSITEMVLKKPNDGSLIIKSWAFKGMSNLKSLTIPGDSEVAWDAFKECPNLTVINTDNLALLTQIENNSGNGLYDYY